MNNATATIRTLNTTIAGRDLELTSFNGGALEVYNVVGGAPDFLCYFSELNGASRVAKAIAAAWRKRWPSKAAAAALVA